MRCSTRFALPTSTAASSSRRSARSMVTTRPDGSQLDRPIYRTNEVLRSLFDSPAIRSALPELLIPDPYPITKPPQFFESATGTFTLAGELASALLRGGPYIRFPGSAAEASQLASAGLADLVGDRYEQFRVFQSEAPWTPWFFDIAWEHTWILADYERLEVS